MDWIGLLVTLVMAILLYDVLRFICYLWRRLFIRSRYEWLDVLEYPRWKLTLEVMADMANRNQSGNGVKLVFSDLRELEKEHLVEWRAVFVLLSEEGMAALLYQHRLTVEGVRKKNEGRESKTNLFLEPVSI